ncbi:transmembrane protein 223 [Seriola lalandi dorsalis]|uniref:transmembrane protein 223 n=1 Tax=Seriola lalandi dorsalis TaxID=1841481 RepID=UPI000C6FA0F4|nr:transmembrane protein 223 [Seriola lalandi dorsalis]
MFLLVVRISRFSFKQAIVILIIAAFRSVTAYVTFSYYGGAPLERTVKCVGRETLKSLSCQIILNVYCVSCPFRCGKNILKMGVERLLNGVLEFYSRQFRLVNVQHKVNAFRNASMSSQTSPSSGLSNRVTCVSGLCSRIFVLTSRRGAVHRQLSARRSLSTSTQPSKDVTLFEHDRTRFFRLLSVFCGGQFLFWTYMAHFAYTELRNTRGATDTGKAKVSTTTTTTGLAGMWSFEMNLGSNTWRYGFTLGCLAIGAGIVGLGILFCRRSVSQVVLHQGGRMVTVCTQSPLGPSRGQRITVPLSEVACHAHRHESPSFIPLRVKGHKFYYLLDKEGTLNNARLFDITVGAYRPV